MYLRSKRHRNAEKRAGTFLFASRPLTKAERRERIFKGGEGEQSKGARARLSGREAYKSVAL